MSAQDDIASFSVAHLPIVKEYAQRMGLVGKIDGALKVVSNINYTLINRIIFFC